jgi:CRISPR-associated protein Csd1
VVAWAVSGEPIPDPVSDTLALCGVTVEGETQGDDQGDVGQTDSLLLGKAMRGYRAKLDPAADVVVMALEAATPGRMAIGFYRELKGSAFLDRIEMWHRRYCWHQTLGWRDGPADKKVPRRFVGAPAPKHIAEIAFGRALQDEVQGATVQRLLPCIVDGRPVPEDLLRSAIRRTCARNSLGDLEFEACLGVTCALFRGTHHEKDYAMALEEDRTTRDYLFGRLLAVAEHIEEAALRVAKEKDRDTAAAKLMQRFAERPASTWKLIELALPPYRSRLRANQPGTLVHLDKVLDAIMVVLPPEDFVDRPLGGEFLLGYHCQRHALFQKVNKDPQPADTQPSAPVLTEGSHS